MGGPDTQSQHCDVLVVGGGPAGCAAARLLALWGRRVVLAVRPDARDHELPESLTPSCQKFFDLMGISAAIDAAGFVRSTGHTVWWGTGDARVEPFRGQAPLAGASLSNLSRGWQVTSGRLALLMRHEAVAAGARLHAAALSVDEILAWPARYRLDCTGRAGVLAKPLGHRRHEAGHRTVALVGVWRRDSSWSLDDPSHTLLESYADGWAWSVPIDDRHRALAVMVDPRTTALAKGDGARAVYLAEIAKTRHLAASMDGATLGDGPFGWDASMYLARHLTGPDWLLVGDAGSFVDPLSSAGVKKALASGWLAAVVTNSALHDTALARPALELFARREAAVYQQFLALTKQFMAEAGGTKPEAHPFWSERAAEDAAPVVPRAAVEAAFERLKAAQQVRLHRAPGVRTEVRPALGERLLTMEPHIVTDDLPDGVRFVLDIDVAALVDLAPGALDVPSLHALYADRIGRVSWPSFLTALATAIARKWLILR